MWEIYYDHSLLRRCKFAVGLLSGRYSQPPKEDTEEGKKEEEAKEGEKKPKVGPRVTCLTHHLPSSPLSLLSLLSPSFPPPRVKRVFVLACSKPSLAEVMLSSAQTDSK